MDASARVPAGIAVKEVSSAAEKTRNNSVLNFALTIPEGMFLAFVKKGVQNCLNEECAYIYLGASEIMQNDFNTWVAHSFSTHQLTSAELNLAAVVSSIWTKIKIFDENSLKNHQNKRLKQIEEEQQKDADKLTKEANSQGELGKFITARQAKFLVEITNNLKNIGTALRHSSNVSFDSKDSPSNN